jgi:nitronate monooxygenase
MSEESVYQSRMRICDLGYLRHAYKSADGQVEQRCPAEPVDDYLKKGGTLEETVGRKCLCNALMADIGMAQKQSDQSFEKPLITAGDDLNNLMKILAGKVNRESYCAADVVKFMGL